MTSNILPPTEAILTRLEIDRDYILALHNRVQRSNYRAALNWLEKQFSYNQSNIGQIRGYLESIYHFYQVKDWNRVWSVLSSPLSTPNQELLFEQLGIWGYYTEVINLLEPLLGKISTHAEAQCLRGLGNAYQLHNRFLDAFECFQKGLAIAQKIGKRELECHFLVGIGNFHRIHGNYEESMDNFQQGLILSKEIDARLSECIFLHFIALAYSHDKNLYQEKQHYQQSLSIALELGNLQWQANNFNNLISTSIKLGDYLIAIQYAYQALDLAQETGDRYVEAWTRLNLASALIELLDREQAQENLNLAMEIFSKQLGNLDGEAHVCFAFARFYKRQANYSEALIYCNQAISIATDLGIHFANECQKLKEEILET